LRNNLWRTEFQKLNKHIKNEELNFNNKVIDRIDGRGQLYII